jgi:hypothetical protein
MAPLRGGGIFATTPLEGVARWSQVGHCAAIGQWRRLRGHHMANDAAALRDVHASAWPWSVGGTSASTTTRSRTSPDCVPTANGVATSATGIRQGRRGEHQSIRASDLMTLRCLS